MSTREPLYDINKKDVDRAPEVCFQGAFRRCSVYYTEGCLFCRKGNFYMEVIYTYRTISYNGYGLYKLGLDKKLSLYMDKNADSGYLQLEDSTTINKRVRGGYEEDALGKVAAKSYILSSYDNNRFQVPLGRVSFVNYFGVGWPRIFEVSKCGEVFFLGVVGLKRTSYVGKSGDSYDIVEVE